MKLFANILILLILAASCSNQPKKLVDSRDQQEYATVKIGDQIWMAENLNYACEGSWYYNNDSSYAEKYGRLYTFEAAQNACPAGWHLPSDEEWQQLEKFMGMPEADLTLEGYRNTEIAKELKTGGTSGLNLEMGGYRMWWGNGSFHYGGDYGDYWTSTKADDTESWYRSFSRFQNTIYRNRIHKNLGNSVRCVKNKE